MSKKKKIIIASIISIIIIAIIVGAICWTIGISKTKEKQEEPTSKLDNVYDELKEKQIFSFTTTLDEKNKMYYAKKGEVAYINTLYEGESSIFIIKDGNSYLLEENQKKYYTYQNNESDLEKVTIELESMKDKEHTDGKEKIDNKEYQYEEYQGATTFLFKNLEYGQEENVKTRFYFKGDELVYIKTIIGEEQETLKVDISDKVENAVFEIPSDYQGV